MAIPTQTHDGLLSDALTAKGAKVVARFWRKVARRGDDECWLWTGAKTKGYGNVGLRVNGRYVRFCAHRISWFLANGSIGVGDNNNVLHRCDVPACVNPAHLFLGSLADNLEDARQKGRLKLGAFRKLSDDAYRDILRKPYVYGSGAALALKYGVHPSYVSSIRNGRGGNAVVLAHESTVAGGSETS